MISRAVNLRVITKDNSETVISISEKEICNTLDVLSQMTSVLSVEVEDFSQHRKAQLEGCYNNNALLLVPSNGICRECRQSVYKTLTVLQASTPLTSCPNCNTSYKTD